MKKNIVKYLSLLIFVYSCKSIKINESSNYRRCTYSIDKTASFNKTITAGGVDEGIILPYEDYYEPMKGWEIFSLITDCTGKGRTSYFMIDSSLCRDVYFVGDSILYSDSLTIVDAITLEQYFGGIVKSFKPKEIYDTGWYRCKKINKSKISSP